MTPEFNYFALHLTGSPLPPLSPLSPLPSRRHRPLGAAKNADRWPSMALRLVEHRRVSGQPWYSRLPN